jgi:hypothetical protein
MQPVSVRRRHRRERFAVVLALAIMLLSATASAWLSGHRHEATINSPAAMPLPDTAQRGPAVSAQPGSGEAECRLALQLEGPTC